MMKKSNFYMALIAMIGNAVLISAPGVCRAQTTPAPAAANADLSTRIPVTDYLVPQTPIVVGPAGKFDYMTADPKNGKVFASHPGTKSLTVVDLTNNTASDINVGTEVNGVAVDAKDGLFLVAGGGGKLFAFDRAGLQQKWEMDLPGPADGIMFDRDNDTLYIDNDDSTNVWAVNPQTQAIVSTIKIGESPEYMAYDRNRKLIYQNIKKDDEIQAIDPSTNTVVSTWPLGPNLSPHGLVYDPVSDRLFSACRPGILAIVDAGTGKTVSTTPLASNVDQIAWDSKTRKIYCPGGGQLTIVSVDESGNATTLGRIPINPGAHTCVVDNKTHDLWICYPSDTDQKSYVQAFSLKTPYVDPND